MHNKMATLEEHYNNKAASWNVTTIIMICPVKRGKSGETPESSRLEI